MSPRRSRARSCARRSRGSTPATRTSPPRLAGFVLDAFRGDPPAPLDPELDQLTRREREVLRLIGSGYTYKEAGAPAHLRQDGGDARLGGPAQAAVVQPVRAEPLGEGPQPGLTHPDLTTDGPATRPAPRVHPKSTTSSEPHRASQLHLRGRRHRRVAEWRLVSLRGSRERLEEADRECRVRCSGLQVEGTRILVRPILAEDKDRLREGLGRLSDESRYRRFLTSLEHLSDEQVRRLTEIDYVNHMAWVALDLARPTHPGIAVARYVRLAEDPTIAEPAVTVLDEYRAEESGRSCSWCSPDRPGLTGSSPFAPTFWRTTPRWFTSCVAWERRWRTRDRCSASTSPSPRGPRSCPTRPQAGCFGPRPGASCPRSASAIRACRSLDTGHWV